MNKCRYLRVRHKKGILYQVCLKHRLEGQINENLCYMCSDKEYRKPKIIKKVSKNREFVTHDTYQQTYLRDEGKCRLCGSKDDLHLHHINGRGKDKTNNVDNCVLLCKKCHLEKVHKNNKYYRPYLNDLIGGKSEINK